MTIKENILLPGVPRWQASDGKVIRLRGVKKSFGSLEVLKGVDLEIEPGKFTVILGRSGSGKTVLMKHINGLVRADAGEIEFFGESISGLKPVALDRLRKRAGMLFQNYALFDSMTVLENVAFPLVENNAMSVASASEAAAKLLGELGLGDVLEEFPAALSGGMKKRVSVARTIIWNPEMLLLDDPTTGLDPVMTEFVDEMLRKIVLENQLSAVMVSHNLASIFRMADSVAVLHDGKIIAHDTPEAIKKSSLPEVHALVAKASRSTIDEGRTADEASEKPHVVEMRDVNKSFGDRHILKGVNFFARKDEITVIIGGSGAGKSVMLKHILGLMRADSGDVQLFGKLVAEMTEEELRASRQKIGMLFQHSALLDSLTIEDNVAFPIFERREATKAQALERAHELLDIWKLKDIALRYPSEISNGQQKRAALARALISKPELMVYDEPTTGQDPVLSDYVEEMILEAQENFNLTSIVISHDMASTMRMAHQVAMLHMGEILLEAPPAEFIASTDKRVSEFVFASSLAPAQKIS